jgi:membrane protein YdbS with pleckstrin-like domain
MMTIESTPREMVEAVDAKPHPRVVSVWRIAALVWAVVFAGVCVAATVAAEVPALWALAPSLLAVALALYMPGARWRAWSYRVGEIDLRIMRGVLWRTESVVLHARIQHVDTRQGPVERMFGLASVVVYTAGSVGAQVGIPGLVAADAEALRDRLAALSGSEDAL